MYEEGRRGHDKYVVTGTTPRIMREGCHYYDEYKQHQRGAAKVDGNTRDTISSCYMDGPGVTDLR